ncbi:hypothetical protein QR680_000624 [Steinernema hermaphroditum]|uniref:Uncharacterized protein n=1 Tax=Steinernema hermaphroditum TaxID=289476 RepID=A0AA39GW05_9BILA|nr:hypothetical protein QR680_000624 [Steinernema hermaphroditum]
MVETGSFIVDMDYKGGFETSVDINDPSKIRLLFSMYEGGFQRDYKPPICEDSRPAHLNNKEVCCDTEHDVPTTRPLSLQTPIGVIPPSPFPITLYPRSPYSINQ